ncbi:MAG: hypothetical protein ACOX5R_15175 [bacterium]
MVVHYTGLGEILRVEVCVEHENGGKRKLQEWQVMRVEPRRAHMV